MKERDRQGKKFPNQLITILFNQSFPDKPDRTMKAVEARKSRINKENETKKEVVIVSQPKITKKKEGRGSPSHDKTAVHGGMGYTVSEDRYLVEHWSPDVNKRQKLAKKLGRTVAGCAGRLSNIKKKHPEYYLILAGGQSVQTVNVLPQGTRKDETMLQRLDYWIVNRKAIKQAKRQAKLERKRKKKEAKLKKKLAKLRGDY